ncbi:MAG: hypothetical protein QM724_08005 [Flavobacteriales bacterium]
MEASTSHRLTLVDAPDRIIPFYLRHWGIDSAAAPFVDVHDRPQAFFDSVVAASQGLVFYGQSSGGTPENVGRLQRLLPFIAERHDFVEGQTFLFSPMPSGHAVLHDLRRQIVTTPQGVEGMGWQVDGALPLWRDTTMMGAPARWDFSGREWGATFEAPVSDLSEMDNDVIEILADVDGTVPESGLRLVAELHQQDSTVFYRTDLIAPGTGHRTLCVAVKLADMTDHGRGMTLKAYLWNDRMAAAHVASLTLQVRQGDPWLYGFYQPLKGPLDFP